MLLCGLTCKLGWRLHIPSSSRVLLKFLSLFSLLIFFSLMLFLSPFQITYLFYFWVFATTRRLFCSGREQQLLLLLRGLLLVEEHRL